MPSLIYIARITRSSEELTQDLQSAGLQVKSFAPGEITADECLLVMTSEAVLASLQPLNAAPSAGHAVETGQELEAAPPPPNMNAHLASQAAIWNRLKAAAAKESATSQPSSVASKIESETENLGFIPSEVGLRALATSQKSAEASQPSPVALARPSTKAGNPSLSPPSLPSVEKSRISPAPQIPATLVGMASRFGGRSRLNGPRYKLFWQTVAIAASMLMFSALRPSTTEVIVGDTTQSTRLVSSSKELRRTVSGTRSQQTEVSKAAEAQLRQSDYFVARDFTNHFTLHVHSIATMQKSELKRNAQGSVSHKRVVIN